MTTNNILVLIMLAVAPMDIPNTSVKLKEVPELGAISLALALLYMLTSKAVGRDIISKFIMILAIDHLPLKYSNETHEISFPSSQTVADKSSSAPQFRTMKT